MIVNCDATSHMFIDPTRTHIEGCKYKFTPLSDANNAPSSIKGQNYFFFVKRDLHYALK